MSTETVWMYELLTPTGKAGATLLFVDEAGTPVSINTPGRADEFQAVIDAIRLELGYEAVTVEIRVTASVPSEGRD